MEWKPDEIKGLRKKLRMSQRELAKKLGVSRTAESLDNAVVICHHIVMIIKHDRKVVKMRSTMKQRSINTDQRLATIGAKVDPVFHKKVKEFTFRNNMSIAYLLEMAIKEFIDRHEKEAEGEPREVSQRDDTASAL